MNKPQTNKTSFANYLINKRHLKDLMYDTFINYGIVKSSIIADRVKNLTFHYATRSGISLSIEDLSVPRKKIGLIGLTDNEVEITRNKYEVGNITEIERYQKTIDIWNNISNFLKDEVLIYFRESDPLNPLYIMAFSGARGNISQVRQLVGMRGLMADPQGQIIDLPIRSNFRQGLNVTEYIISSYGARKGLVDTALRTADSGYLTRRLVDVAQHIIIREEDCHTKNGLYEHEIYGKKEIDLTRLVGRVLLKPFISKAGELISDAGGVVTPELIKRAKGLEYKQIKVRSPLTCDSTRSVCQKCYGWHLAYSRVVDLGEAIGIVAAQSIGEPGTQLTMRTFHTGGVFSGDLTDQIRAPFAGVAFYDSNNEAFLFRTLYGATGFQVKEKITFSLSSSSNLTAQFEIPKGSILLVNNKQQVYKNEIIAEIKKDVAVIFDEEEKDIITEKSGEVYLPTTLKPGQIITSKAWSTKNRNAQRIWVLYGKHYHLTRSNTFKLKSGTILSQDRVVAKTSITNHYSGIVELGFDGKETPTFNILHHTATLKNITSCCYDNDSKSYKFSLLDDNTTFDFSLIAKSNTILKKGDNVAALIEDSYKTETGGIITYSIDNEALTKNKRSIRRLFNGFCYWIPEETFQLENRKEFGLVKVKKGCFVTQGEEILPNAFSKTSGIVEFNETELQVIIKPGELLHICDENFPRVNRFVKKGEYIFENRVVAQSLIYLDFLNTVYVLVRPVKSYSISKVKSFSIGTSFFPDSSKATIRLKPVKRMFYKNWERVINRDGVNLLQTFLVLDIKKSLHSNLQPKIEVIPTANDVLPKIQLSLYEVIKAKDLLPPNSNKSFRVKIRPVIHTGQYVFSNSTLAYVELLIRTSGIAISIKPNSFSEEEVLILDDNYLKKVHHNLSPDQLRIKIGDLVRIGANLGKGLKAPYTGHIYKITPGYILIRLGHSYLVSNGTILQTTNGSLVKAGDTLATLVYSRVKTTDIVQGLPKVEETLEARKVKRSCILSPCSGYAYWRVKQNIIEIFTLDGEIIRCPIPLKTKVQFRNGQYIDLANPLTDGAINPHEMLDVLFDYYVCKKYPITEACKNSVKQLQLFLVNDVQKTYLSQGVQISDKHIEVIVRQMTSKVYIKSSGATTLLPGEILDFRKVINISHIAKLNGEKPPTYKPILLGITKASLNSDSFISAASFQETTRVLTEAAIEGKKDWLNGLKENVIVGRLIPAGTGFSRAEHRAMLKREREGLDKNFHSDVRALTDKPLKNSEIIGLGKNL
uniref:RNA polymerase beta'' subunit n=1 Tax=Chrysotila carterae TaxID=13221 RepID=UPI0022F30ECD|nr:RNA polymerase beta'' subunit [Chrysotila carterae]WAK83148.1 RNA polymerase beta'' subunit [Chrysotila carterae]